MTIESINLLCCVFITPAVYLMLRKSALTAIFVGTVLPVIAANIIIICNTPDQELGAMYGLAAIYWSIMDMFVSAFLMFIAEVTIQKGK